MFNFSRDLHHPVRLRLPPLQRRGIVVSHLEPLNSPPSEGYAEGGGWFLNELTLCSYSMILNVIQFVTTDNKNRQQAVADLGTILCIDLAKELEGAN